jgi:zinc protease
MGHPYAYKTVTMKKALFITLTTLTLTASSQSLFPPVEKFKLKNGLEVYIVDYGTLPVTSVNLYVNTGKKNELPGLQSIAQLTASALLLGNEKWSRIDQDEQLAAMGTRINASVNDQYTEVSTYFLNRDIDAGLELLSQVLLKPKFPKEDIATMIQRQIDYNNPKKMDISQLAAVFSDNFVYGTANPLGRYFYAAQLQKITRDSINEFYKFNYTPKNSKLVISGKPDREKVKKLIEQYFGGWEAAYGEVNGVSYDVLPIKKKEYGFIHKGKAPQTALRWNKKAPEAKSKDLVAFELANTIFNDILFREIRAKNGFTYGIHSNFIPEDNNGIYSVATLVRNEVTWACIQEFDRVLKEFYEKGLSEAELKIAKTRMKGDILSMQRPGELVSFINPLLYPDYEKRKQLLNEIDKLDLAAVNKVIKKYFTPDSYKLVISGDETAIADQLAKIPGLVKFDPKAIEVNN